MTLGTDGVDTHIMVAVTITETLITMVDIQVTGTIHIMDTTLLIMDIIPITDTTHIMGTILRTEIIQIMEIQEEMFILEEIQMEIIREQQDHRVEMELANREGHQLACQIQLDQQPAFLRTQQLDQQLVLKGHQ